MPRVSRELQKQIDKAEKEAKRAVFKPKKKERKQTSDVPAQETKKHYIAEWVKDPLHPNREVFFDGTRYWFTLVLPNGSVTAQSLTVEEWNNRIESAKVQKGETPRKRKAPRESKVGTKPERKKRKKVGRIKGGPIFKPCRKSTRKTTPSTRIMKRRRSKK